ncbi:hypothetical protein D3C78_1974540 [compost metagenome]
MLAMCAMPASGTRVSMEPVPASTAAAIRRPRMGCSIRLIGPAWLLWLLMGKTGKSVHKFNG